MRTSLLLLCTSLWIGTARSQFIADGPGPMLNEYIRHFEPLYFDPHTFQEQHRRAKRSPKSEIRLEFAAHSRVFKLRMRPDKSIFAADVIFESAGGQMDYDTSNVLQGSLEDEEDSSATGVFTAEGLFDGVVRSRREEFYIEPARRYFASPRRFHSVIYRVADVHYPAAGGKNLSSCRSQLLHRKMKVWSHDVQGAVDRQVRVRKASRTLRYKDEHGGDSEPYGVRSVQRTHWSDDRTERHVVIDPRKTTCMLYLQADHLFYQKMGSEEACIETMTRHVQKVNSIYKTTDFDQDARPDNISFLIKRIKVHSAPQEERGYRFPGNYGVEKFLELFSEEDYDSFCLAYMFTYRDFEGGTLGLAWTGDLKNAGGVCEKNGHYRGSLKSLNTGIVTLLNYGKHVPPIVSHVTLAHEIGHNFGSPHDPEDDRFCTPGGENGNYIMFARATSGDKKNNNRFSPCSLKSINSVLNTKARSIRGCFTEPQDAICGNEVVERGEECDCGWEEDCSEPCCFPMRANPPPSEPPCRLRPDVVCSPSQGPCCTQDCLLKLGDKCRDDNGCRSASFCDGNGPRCPSSINKPNKTICNAEFVCYMGECTGSICVAYGLESCQCSRGPRDPVTKSCELCCKLPGNDRSCRSSFEWNAPPYDVPDMFAKPGTPCDNYNGYCDVFQKCREVDPSGPLATLRKLLLSNESMASLKQWLLGHWWGVLLLCLGAMLLLLVTVKIFGRKGDLKDEGRLSQDEPFFRSCSNQALAKARAQQQQQAASHSVAALGATSVKTSLSIQSDKPLALSGNGWV